MTRNILLTGGTGYLGRNFIKVLIKNDYNIYLFVRDGSDLKKIEPYLNQVTIIKNASSLPTVDIFIHMATVYGRMNETKDEIFQSNFNWPLSLLEKVSHSNLTFINTDTSLPRDFNNYSKSKKYFIEEVIRNYPYLRIINMICEQFYGPGDGSFVNFIAKELKAGNDIEMTEGLQRRDLIYIDDVLNAYMTILSNINSMSKGLYEYPVGSGHAFSIREVATQVCEILDCPHEHLKWGAKPMREGEPMKLIADPSLMMELGWQPKYSLESGLKLTLNNLL